MKLIEPKEIVKAGWTTGFNIFRIYCALKGHFQGTFDIQKYGIKTRVKRESFDKRKDSVFFDRMASKLSAKDCYEMMLFNMASNPDCLSYELSSAGAHTFYLQYSGRLDTLSKHYRKELEAIFTLLSQHEKKFKDLLSGDGHPVILQLLIRQTVSIETILLIDSFLPIIEKINEKYQDDILWMSWYTKLSQYRKLLTINTELAKNIFLDVKSSLHN